MHKERLKQLAYTLGKSLGFLGLFYVLYTLYQEYTFSSFVENFYAIASTLPLLFILNILSIVIGIIAWHIMLKHYADKPFSYLESYYYFTKTEIAKYLPGNIFHFVGRQALASKVGISQIQMAKISVLFTFLLLAGTILSSTFFAVFATHIPSYILLLMTLSSLIAIGVSLLTYTSFPISKKLQMNALLALSIALQGILLGLVVMSQLESFSIGLFFQISSIYIISWLIGFVTPGASGGLGIREGAFIAIASYLHIGIASDVVIFSVLLVRLINIFTDVLTYLSTFTLTQNIKEV